MTNKLISILILLLGFLTINSRAANCSNDSVQTYSLQSIDGTTQAINIESNYIENQLIVSSLNDTIKISDFTGFDKSIKKLNNIFLEITYRVRGGSNIKLRHVLILCVIHKRLYQALHITNLSSYGVDMVYNARADSLKLFDEYGLMSLKYDLTETVKKQYLLDVTIHDEIKSKQDPKTNHNYNKQVALTFNINQGIFYNALESVSQYFTIYDPKTMKESKQYFIGIYPMIQLGSYSYYCIKGEWYEKGRNDNLSKYSY